MREEIGGVREANDPAARPNIIKADATVESDNKTVFTDTEKALPLPEDYTPKASKRPKPK